MKSHRRATAALAAALAARIGARVRTCSGGHTSEDCLLQAAEVLGKP